MSTATRALSQASFSPTAFAAQLRDRAPFWWWAGLAALALFVVFFAMGFLDDRAINGVSIWDKPAKFHLSFAVHMMTFAWAFALMPPAERQAFRIKWLSLAFVAIFAAEMAYIIFRAARVEASHFNTGTEMAALLYSLMGLGAVSLTAITGYFGWRLVRTKRDLAARAAGTGLMLGALLGTLTAAYLSSRSTGHWVGGEMSDATGLPFFHWSTTGGDLRVAHFVGLHTMQAIPMAAWLWPSCKTIVVASAAMVVLTAAVFVQAWAGLPLIPV